MKKIFLLIVVAVAIAGAGASYYTYSQLSWKYAGEKQEILIKPGEGFAKINYRLFKNGIIKDARFFHYYAKFQGKMDKLKSGLYLFEAGVSTPDVLAILSEGKSQLYEVTIPEGKNLYQIAGILEAKEIILDKNEFIKIAKSPKLLKEFNVSKAVNVEGYLFPDTYKFSPKSSPDLVIQTMIQQHFHRTKGLTFNHPKLNRHELITLASVVEKETGAKFERKTIAGVFFNRLKKKMRLQSDPTTIYGIWENFNGNLRRKHLREKTPYNTYAIYGVPLGPIANPGLEAIKAVLSPEAHEFLYFVSKNNGTHVFSKNYKDHSKAVDYWQKIKKNREGRSWRDLKQ